jgi:hypothetical protein
LKSDTPTRRYFSLGPKPNVTALSNLAITVDAYRNFIFGKLDSFDKEITARKYGTDILAAWKETYASLRRIEAAGRSIRGMETIWKLRSGSLLAGMVLVMLAMVSITTRMNAWVFYGSFYAALIMLSVYGGTSYLSSRRTNSYLRRHASEHSADMAHIKDFVQRLLNSLSRYFRVSKIDPAKYPLGLYNADYEKIRVQKNPGFRRTYEVIIELS